MSDNQATPNGANEATQARTVPIHVQAQYIKDLSFESPGAPESLRRDGPVPQTDIQINMEARPMGEGETKDYEVVLSVRAETKKDDKTWFLGELDYGMVVTIGDIAEQHHHPVLMIEAPRIAFPFVRQILADLTLQAGFPPLYLAPVDFAALYQEQYKAQRQAAEAQAAGSVN